MSTLRERWQGSSVDHEDFRKDVRISSCVRHRGYAHYFKEIEQYFNENLHLPLEIYLADQGGGGLFKSPGGPLLRDGASGCKGLPLQRGRR